MSHSVGTTLAVPDTDGTLARRRPRRAFEPILYFTPRSRIVPPFPKLQNFQLAAPLPFIFGIETNGLKSVLWVYSSTI